MLLTMQDGLIACNDTLKLTLTIMNQLSSTYHMRSYCNTKLKTKKVKLTSYKLTSVQTKTYLMCIKCIYLKNLTIQDYQNLYGRGFHKQRLGEEEKLTKVTETPSDLVIQNLVFPCSLRCKMA